MAHANLEVQTVLLILLLLVGYSRPHNYDDSFVLDCETSDPTWEEKTETARVVAASHRTTNSNLFLRRAGDVFRVPVHIHVFRDDDGSKDVSDAMVNEYMGYLNDAFDVTPFVFELQPPIHRINNSVVNACSQSSYKNWAGYYKIGGVGDLNIYFCDITSGASGWGTKPPNAGKPDDGVVLRSTYTKLGLPANFTLRPVLPHETGHWLGLYHTFESQCSASFKNDTAWPDEYSYFAGDGVPDTPAHTKQYNNCSQPWDTCANNISGVDPG